MLLDKQNTIQSDHQGMLEEQFEHITYLLNNDKTENAIELLLNLHYADLADFIDNASKKHYYVILPKIADKINPEFLACLSDGNKQRAIEALGITKSANLINNLDIEDGLEVIDDLSVNLKKAIIDKLNPEKRKQILEGFQYGENTAGRILEKSFVAFKQHWTAGQAIDYIRRSKIQTDFHAAIIVNTRSHPVGTLLLSTLLKSPRNTPLEKLMNKEFKIAETNTEIDELAFIFKKYALTIVPVTNKQGKLVGSISIDNMIYIIEEQTETEFMHLGGINNSDIFSNLFASAKHRFPWLFVNLVTACLTSLVIDQFSETIAKLVTLATIMPIVASMGGNAGTQTMTVTVRALANREITGANTRRVISKEILLCMLNGALLALIGITLTYLLFADVNLSIVFASAVLINFVIAGFLGSGIPILLNYLNVDPAAASGVFLTACTDAIGFFSFLSLAYFFLV
ncbi:MAG: magnesium transporter [Rickettsiaceae bacterium]|nr:magnesium transporter [Rickettsiaceae bacterium]